MSRLDDLLEKVDHTLEPGEQLDKLAAFDHLSNEELAELTSIRNIKTFAAGYVIEYLGYQKVKKHIRELLEYLQDYNWPAARFIDRMLRDADEDIIPEVRRIIYEEKNDWIWHMWLMGSMSEWKKEVLIQLKPDIIEVVKRADREDAAIMALHALKESEIAGKEEVDELFDLLKEGFQDHKPSMEFLYWRIRGEDI